MNNFEFGEKLAEKIIDFVNQRLLEAILPLQLRIDDLNQQIKNMRSEVANDN